MPIASVADLMAELRSLHLVGPDQLEQLSRQTRGTPDPRTLARQLIESGLLTPYQVNQLFSGRGLDLLLGGYVLLERLGEGGMGTVFKARNWQTGQLVALLNAVRRFYREARTASHLHHPNVVHAFEAAQVGDTHSFIMEFVEGTDLARLVKVSGPLGVDQACDYIRQAALGLQHAFERGLVHRDIKPHNLMVTGSGAGGFGLVKILDLGLARLTQPITGDESSTTLTQEGAVLGTPDYLSPEQAMGAPEIDIRADLYSLGCTFYFLLTGQPPFPGGALGAKLVKHQIAEPEPVTKLRPDVPAAVAAVVHKLLAKSPEARFQTPAELAAAVQGLVRQPASAAAIPFAVPVTATNAETPPGLQAARDATQPEPPPGRATPHSSPPAQEGGGKTKSSRRVWLASVILLLCLGMAAAGILLFGPWGPAGQPQPEPVVINSIGMKLVLVRAGDFLMGSAASEAQRQENEGPQRLVRLSRPFYLGAFEVTQGQFRQVMGTNPSFFAESAELPVEQVTWDEAMAFCRQLAQLPAEQAAGRTYRLPTEAEWEYACRAGTTTPFPCGDLLSSTQANCNGSQPYGSAPKGPYAGRPVKVGSYPPNPWGLHDMDGNVMEWCLDGPQDYATAAEQDPRGPEEGRIRAVRGGGWFFFPHQCRSASRFTAQARIRENDLGFRVLCEVSSP
jgi:formylglycine-generating enzyme required for sulfatase activity